MSARSNSFPLPPFHFIFTPSFPLSFLNFSSAHPFSTAASTLRREAASLNSTSRVRDGAPSADAFSYILSPSMKRAWWQRFLPAHAIVFTQWSKNGFFASQGRHVAPTNVPNFTFIGEKMWEYSPQNCQNFEFWPEICTSGATRLQYFCEILSICTRL